MLPSGAEISAKLQVTVPPMECPEWTQVSLGASDVLPAKEEGKGEEFDLRRQGIGKDHAGGVGGAQVLRADDIGHVRASGGGAL